MDKALIDDLPTTVGGKLNRAALPLIDIAAPATGAARRAEPASEMERLLAVLGNDVTDYKSMPKLASAFGLNSSSCIFSRELDLSLHHISTEKDVVRGGSGECN